MTKSVLAVVVSFNDGAALTKTVNALVGQVGKVVIIDNGSSSETRSCIAELETRLGITPVYLIENMGIGRALNGGVSIARHENYEWLLTMDQDSIAAPEMVAEMLACAEKHHDAAIICPALSTAKSARRGEDEEVGSTITSGNMVRLEYLQSIGGYNESYFIDSVDFEFNLRIRNAGYKIIRSGSSKLSHRLGEMKIFELMGLQYRYTLHSPMRRYYMYRNHVRLMMEFWCKNPAFLIKKTIMAIFAMIEIVICDPQPWGNLKMIWRGIVDGFKLKGESYSKCRAM